MNPQTFIFIGKSGCGKGTQAELLIEYIKEKSDAPVFYMESGERFRDFISQSSYTAKLSRGVMQSGQLQPAFMAIHIWAHALIEQMDEGKHLLIDGAPRKLDEAKILDEAFKFYNLKNVNIVYINVSDQWSIDRLTGRGRADDKSTDEIKKRLNWFETSALPAVEYYRTNPDYNFFDINGEQTIPEVHQEILSKLTI